MSTLELFKDKPYYIMHYSSSDIKEVPVEICCIVVLDGLTTEVDKIFSRIDYDEKELVKKFFDFYKKLKKPILTWNMKKDYTYGPLQIARRYRDYYGKEPKVKLEQFYDLDALFTVKYGKNYVTHPKMRTLAKLNDLQLLDLLDGPEEAEIYKLKNFRKLELSCTRKTYLISKFITLYLKGELKINTLESNSRKDNFIETKAFDPYSINKEDIEHLIYSASESKFWDFKYELNIHDNETKSEFIKDMVSLANIAVKENTSTMLIIGVSDDKKKIQSITLNDQSVYENILKSYVYPQIDFGLRYIEIRNNTIAVFKILPNLTIPFTIIKELKGTNNKMLLNISDSWIRIGSSKKYLSHQEVMEFTEKLRVFRN